MTHEIFLVRPYVGVVPRKSRQGTFQEARGLDRLEKVFRRNELNESIEGDWRRIFIYYLAWSPYIPTIVTSINWSSQDPHALSSPPFFNSPSILIPTFVASSHTIRF